MQRMRAPNSVQELTQSCVYGNWCGGGCIGTGGNPIDNLDEACYEHDTCLVDADRCHECACHQALVDRASHVSWQQGGSRPGPGAMCALWLAPSQPCFAALWACRRCAFRLPGNRVFTVCRQQLLLREELCSTDPGMPVHQ